MDRIRLLVADDVESIRHAMREYVADAEDIHVVGTAEDGLEALILYHGLRPNVVAMDINMPVMDGITATRCLTALYPDARVFMITPGQQESTISNAVDAGTLAFLFTPPTREELFSTIRKAADSRPAPDRDPPAPDAGPGRVQRRLAPYLEAANWVLAFLAPGRARHNNLRVLHMIVESGALGDDPWYKATPQMLSERIDALAACDQELKHGPKEPSWRELLNPAPSLTRIQPHSLLPYHTYVMESYRTMARAQHRLIECLKVTRRVRAGEVPEGSVRDRVAEQIKAADQELNWVRRRIRDALTTFVLLPLHEEGLV